jgi:anti-sigma regulatory factor (Ser/Thr protein kinase)
MRGVAKQVGPGAEERLGMASWDGASEGSLAQALRPPVTECVEEVLMGRYRWRSPRGSSRRHLSLIATTRSSYRNGIAKAFVDAIGARIPISLDLHQRVHSALQEALMNAMIHGNLGLDSALRDTMRELAAWHEIIETRLAVEAIALSAIRISAAWTKTVLKIMVRDSGAGFKRSDLPSPEQWQAAGHYGSGRGFAILGAFCDRVAIVQGGTTIQLGFRL